MENSNNGTPHYIFYVVIILCVIVSFMSLNNKIIKENENLVQALYEIQVKYQDIENNVEESNAKIDQLIKLNRELENNITILEEKINAISNKNDSEEFYNFNDFTLVGNHIVKDTFIVQVINLTKGEDSYLYLEKESGLSDFCYEVQIRPISAERGGLVNVLALSNELDDWYQLDEGIAVHLSRHETNNEWRIRLKEKSSTESPFYSFPITDLSWKYLRIEREGNTLSLKIFEDSWTKLLTTLELDVSLRSYDYVLTACSSNAGKNDQWISAEILNLELK